MFSLLSGEGLDDKKYQKCEEVNYNLDLPFDATLLGNNCLMILFKLKDFCTGGGAFGVDVFCPTTSIKLFNGPTSDA